MRAFKKTTNTADLAKIEQISQNFLEKNGVLEPAQEIQSSPNPYTGKNILDIPLSKIKDNPYNARRIVSSIGLEELASSIKNTGQTTAALGYFDADEMVCLIDGHRRRYALQIAGFSTIRIEIRPKPKNDQALYLESRIANIQREQQTPLDDAIAWKLLLEQKIFTSQVELAKALNIDQTVVSRTLGLAEIPKPIIRMLSERSALMNFRMLDALRRFIDVCGEERGEALILEVDRDGLSSRDVDKRRKAFEEGPISRKRGATQILEYKRGRASVKRFDDQGRIMIEVKDVIDTDALDQISNKINELLLSVLKD